MKYQRRVIPTVEQCWGQDWSADEEYDRLCAAVNAALGRSPATEHPATSMKLSQLREKARYIANEGIGCPPDPMPGVRSWAKDEPTLARTLWLLDRDVQDWLVQKAEHCDGPRESFLQWFGKTEETRRRSLRVTRVAWERYEPKDARVKAELKAKELWCVG